MKRTTIIDFVEHYTHEFAQHTFLREKVNDVWQETTFEQTRLQAQRIGAALMALGLEKGDKIALLSEGRNLWVIGELGILYAGGVNVPLSIKLEESNDLLFRLQHSEARFVMVSGQQLHKIRNILPQLPNIEKLIVFDKLPDLQPDELYIEDLQPIGDQFLKEHNDLFVARYQSIQPDDYANISYTSGTTSVPKGVLLTHRNYTANVEQVHSVIGVNVDEVMLIALPLDHCFAHVAGFYTMMSYGGSIATTPVGKNALATLRNIPKAIKEVRPHVMLSVPTLARSIRSNIEKNIDNKGLLVRLLYKTALDLTIKYNKEYWNAGTEPIDLIRKPFVKLLDRIVFRPIRNGLGGRMVYFVSGGASLDIQLQRYYNAIGIPMFQGYGLSEATPIICSNAPHHAVLGSSGRIVQPLDVKICDSEGNLLPNGEKGEIVVRGENVMAGYWKNEQSTAETIQDGWLHTGDMGYLSAEHPQYLYVTGRFKSLLISSDGEKYSPEGFEDSLTDTSRYINQVLLHNNQDPYTIVLIVPNTDALKAWVRRHGKKPQTEEGKRMMLKKIQDEVNAYRKGGKKAGLFPEQWLPKAIVVLGESFTEQNRMLNSSMKIVRGNVEKHFADRIQYAYTLEGKDLYNAQNMSAIA